MKNLIICLALFLVSSNYGFANNGSPSTAIESKYNVSKIFYNDFEEELLFVDFEMLGSNIFTISILKDELLLMEDDVRDLPDNTIYEINLDLIQPGSYTLEIVTEYNIRIIKEIVID